MKKRTMVLFIATCMCAGMLTACGNKNAKTAETETVAATEATEAHEHSYTEAVTTPATCTEDGVKTYTCECGDTYTEAIPATGHSFTNYVYNNDASYEANGTETAKCDNCDATDTRTAEGTQLAYTFKDMDATKYAKSSINVRNMPGTDGEKIGTLSFNQEVKVTGQCNETGWYRIEYSGGTAYASNSYLVDNKIETSKSSSKSKGSSGSGSTPASSGSNSSGSATASSSSGSTANSGGPTLNTIFYDNRGLPYFYILHGTYGTESCDELRNKAYAAWNDNSGRYALSTQTGNKYDLMYTILETVEDSNTTPEDLGINTSCLD